MRSPLCSTAGEPVTGAGARALLDHPLFRHPSPELSKEAYRSQVLACLKVTWDTEEVESAPEEP